MHREERKDAPCIELFRPVSETHLLLANDAELARLENVTQARMTQIMNLLMLAPEIQEEILFLPRVEGGRDPIHIRQLQSIAMVPDWRKHRQLWSSMMAGADNQ